VWKSGGIRNFRRPWRKIICRNDELKHGAVKFLYREIDSVYAALARCGSSDAWRVLRGTKKVTTIFD
jgi:hypothetical protein